MADGLTVRIPDFAGRPRGPAPLPYDVRVVLERVSDEALDWAYQLARWTGTDAEGDRWFVVRRNGWPWYACRAPSGRAAETEAAMLGGAAEYHGIYVGAAPLPDLVCIGRRVEEPGFRHEG